MSAAKMAGTSCADHETHPYSLVRLTNITVLFLALPSAYLFLLHHNQVKTIPTSEDAIPSTDRPGNGNDQVVSFPVEDLDTNVGVGSRGRTLVLQKRTELTLTRNKKNRDYLIIPRHGKQVEPELRGGYCLFT